MNKNEIRLQIFKHYKPEVRDERLAKLSNMLLNTAAEFIYQLTKYVTEKQLTLIEKQCHDALKLIVRSENPTSIKIGFLGKDFEISLNLNNKSKFYIKISKLSFALISDSGVLDVNYIKIKNLENVSNEVLEQKIINFAYYCAINL